MVVTGFKGARARKLTPADGEATRILAARRAPVERGFAHLKNWRILTKLRTDHARATHLLRAARADAHRGHYRKLISTAVSPRPAQAPRNSVTEPGSPG
ncbi:transposase family protein [Streptomyces sp. NPDC086549]|uniref:transposase family protein n=1 Tax=Streptomyces sp. NPDC086549 TaxID=3365752 RepID=UPI0038303BB7